ncbi:hypothetical protein Tco_0482495 [Tanacetum coccineum]
MLRVLQELSLQEQVGITQGNRGLLHVTTAKGKDTCPNNAPNQGGNGVIHGIPEGQATQTVNTHNAAYQADDFGMQYRPLIVMNFSILPKVALIANFYLNYGSDALSEVISSSEQSNVAAVQNSNSSAQQDALKIKSNLDSSLGRPTKVEVPKEHPKVSMVNTSLKKLKYLLLRFDVVSRKNHNPQAITEGLWGFEHTKAYFKDEIIPFVKALKDLFNTFNQYLVDELSEVQNVFHQMEQAVEQDRL